MPPGADERLLNDLDRRLDAALRDAVAEANGGGHPALATGLDELRTYLAHWRDLAAARMKELGVYSMTPEQYELWLSIMSKALADRVVAEARAREAEERAQWWQHWQARVAVIASVASLVTVAVGSTYGLFFGGTHALFYTVFHH